MDKKITKDMTISEIFQKFPESQDKIAEILMNAGLACVGCAASQFESLEQGLKNHGINEETTSKVISDLNSAVSA